MPLLLRPEITALTVSAPGAAPPGVAPLGANEIPYGPLPGVAEAITAAAATVHRYPDAAVTALRERLGVHLGAGVDRIATGCGSVGLLEHVIRTCCVPGDEVVFSRPSFEAYPMLCAVAGVTAVPVGNTAAHGHDLPAMAAAVTGRTRLVIVCNPNNPTGTAVHHAELAAFLDAVPSSVVVVLDEAYHEFVTDPRVPDGLAEHGTRDNVVVLRTLSKAWGLAGLRAGYLIGDPALAAAVRKVVTTFSVNLLAQVAGVAALDAAAEMRRRVTLVTAERRRVLDAVRARWPDAPDSQGNFVWLPAGDRSAAVGAACHAGGVAVRAFPGVGVRATIGTTEQNDLLLAALA